MGRKHNHNVPRAERAPIIVNAREPAKLLDFVMHILDGISRNKAKSILSHGGVSVDGHVQTHVDFPIEPGNVVSISRTPQNTTKPNPRHFRIVFEDQWLVVVDKEPGVLSMGVGAGGLNMKSLLDRYKLETEETEGDKLLELVGRKRGMLLSGGVVNTERAAVTVLDDFRGAKLGRITLEAPPGKEMRT